MSCGRRDSRHSGKLRVVPARYSSPPRSYLERSPSTLLQPARIPIRSMFDQAVPAVWQSKAYPSLKPLGPWYQDLLDRLAFMTNWVDHGIPPVTLRKFSVQDRKSRTYYVFFYLNVRRKEARRAHTTLAPIHSHSRHNRAVPPALLQYTSGNYIPYFVSLQTPLNSVDNSPTARNVPSKVPSKR